MAHLKKQLRPATSLPHLNPLIERAPWFKYIDFLYLQPGSHQLQVTATIADGQVAANNMNLLVEK